MKKRLTMGWLAFFLLLVTTGDSLFGFTRMGGRTVTVPNLVGETEGEVVIPEWATLKTEYKYDSDVAFGVVIEQEPLPNAVVKVDPRRPCVLTLTVSMGVEKMTVPNVLGMDRRDAASALRERGFSVSEVYQKGGVANRVTAVTPSVGKELNAGESVTITVSLGETVETVTLPDLTGLSRASALLELFRLGLHVSSVSEELHTDAPDGTVIRQSPPPGAILARGTKVHLTVATMDID